MDNEMRGAYIRHGKTEEDIKLRSET